VNELFDGTVITRPIPTPRHQMLVNALAGALRAGRTDLHVLTGVTVQLSPHRVVVPDLVVTGPIDLDDPVVHAADVRLVVEVVTPATAAVDTTLKMRGYADAGIPWYLLVEQDSHALHGHYLEGGDYVERSVMQLESLLAKEMS
jgi:Uma2 family endonuclease